MERDRDVVDRRHPPQGWYRLPVGDEMAIGTRERYQMVSRRVRNSSLAVISHLAIKRLVFPKCSPGSPVTTITVLSW